MSTRGIRAARPVAGAVVAAGALVFLAACGGGDQSSGGAPSAAPAPSSPAAAAPAGQTQTVQVQMTEFKLMLPSDHLAPGTYTFDAVNAGKLMHGIVLDGPGVEDQKSSVVPGGQSSTLTATLQPGQYDMYCPVGMHRQRGMEVKFTVG